MLRSFWGPLPALRVADTYTYKPCDTWPLLQMQAPRPLLHPNPPSGRHHRLTVPRGQGPTPVAGCCFHLPWFLQLLTLRPCSTHTWWNLKVTVKLETVMEGIYKKIRTDCDDQVQDSVRQAYQPGPCLHATGQNLFILPPLYFPSHFLSPSLLVPTFDPSPKLSLVCFA